MSHLSPPTSLQQRNRKENRSGGGGGHFSPPMDSSSPPATMKPTTIRSPIQSYSSRRQIAQQRHSASDFSSPSSRQKPNISNSLSADYHNSSQHSVASSTTRDHSTVERDLDNSSTIQESILSEDLSDTSSIDSLSILSSLRRKHREKQKQRSQLTREQSDISSPSGHHHFDSPSQNSASRLSLFERRRLRDQQRISHTPTRDQQQQQEPVQTSNPEATNSNTSQNASTAESRKLTKERLLNMMKDRRQQEAEKVSSSLYSKNNFSIKQARETEQKLKHELQQLDQELHEMSDADLFNTMMDSIQQYKQNLQKEEEEKRRQPSSSRSSLNSSAHSAQEEQNTSHQSRGHQEKEAKPTVSSADAKQYVDIIEVLREKLEITMQELSYEKEKVKKLLQTQKEHLMEENRSKTPPLMSEAKSVQDASESTSSPTQNHEKNNQSRGRKSMVHSPDSPETETVPSSSDIESTQQNLPQPSEEMNELRAENQTLKLNLKLLQNHNEMLKQQLLTERRNSKLTRRHCKKLESLIAFQKEEVHNFIVSHSAYPEMSSPRRRNSSSQRQNEAHHGQDFWSQVSGAVTSPSNEALGDISPIARRRSIHSSSPQDLSSRISTKHRLGSDVPDAKRRSLSQSDMRRIKMAAMAHRQAEASESQQYSSRRSSGSLSARSRDSRTIEQADSGRSARGSSSRRAKWR